MAIFCDTEMNLAEATTLDNPLIGLSAEEIFSGLFEEEEPPVIDPFLDDIGLLPQREVDGVQWIYGISNFLSDAHVDEVLAPDFGFEEEDDYVQRLTASDDVEPPVSPSDYIPQQSSIVLLYCSNGVVIVSDEDHYREYLSGLVKEVVFLEDMHVEAIDLDHPGLVAETETEIHPLEALPIKKKGDLYADCDEETHVSKPRTKLNTGEIVRRLKRDFLRGIQDPWSEFEYEPFQKPMAPPTVPVMARA